MCNTFRQQSAAADKWSWIHRGEPANIVPPDWGPGHIWDTERSTATDDEPSERNGRPTITATFAIRPSWTPYPLANARLETADRKRTFQTATARGRIIVPGVDAWRERMTAGMPRGQSRGTAELAIGTAGRRNLAGLLLTGEGGDVPKTASPPADRYFVVLTHAAPTPLAGIHDRAPVRLTDGEAEAWLHGEPSEAMRAVRNAARGDTGRDVTIATNVGTDGH